MYKICHPGNYHQFLLQLYCGHCCDKYQQCSLMSLSSTTFSFDFDLQHTAACIQNDWTQTSNGDPLWAACYTVFLYSQSRCLACLLNPPQMLPCWNSPCSSPRWPAAFRRRHRTTPSRPSISISCALRTRRPLTLCGRPVTAWSTTGSAMATCWS